MIKLRRGNHSGTFIWAQCNHRVFVREKEEGHSQKKEMGDGDRGWSVVL